MLRRLIILLAVVASGLIAATSASASATTEKIPFDIVLAPEEACGEAIHLSGTLLAQFRFTESPRGNVTIGFHFNPQGITGVGLTSGATYHATGEDARDHDAQGDGRHLGHVREQLQDHRRRECAELSSDGRHSPHREREGCRDGDRREVDDSLRLASCVRRATAGARAALRFP